jgi:hypothetical protein
MQEARQQRKVKANNHNIYLTGKTYKILYCVGGFKIIILWKKKILESYYLLLLYFIIDNTAKVWEDMTYLVI